MRAVCEKCMGLGWVEAKPSELHTDDRGVRGVLVHLKPCACPAGEVNRMIEEHYDQRAAHD